MATWNLTVGIGILKSVRSGRGDYNTAKKNQGGARPAVGSGRRGDCGAKNHPGEPSGKKGRMDFTEQYLQTIDEVIAAGPYDDRWDSLAAYQVPKWYRQAKFGLFIHWGIYSVPAFGNEWYSRNMYIQGSGEFEHHIKTYGPHKEFGYKDFIPLFTASAFDPEE